MFSLRARTVAPSPVMVPWYYFTLFVWIFYFCIAFVVSTVSLDENWGFLNESCNCELPKLPQFVQVHNKSWYRAHNRPIEQHMLIHGSNF